MSNFNNSQAYNVSTENELTNVLSHYSSDFVYSIVEEAMKSRFSSVPTVFSVPNVVGAWEQNFKFIRATYGEDNKEEILRVRNSTYEEIIESICREFSLTFTVDDNVDLYSAAYHLYDLLVCNFSQNLINFFSNFIYRERASIYDSLNLANLKKNKDISTIYGKKIYKDIKLAVINANIDMIITEICSMDIPFENIVSIVCGNNSELKKFILSIVSAKSDFFNTAYVSILRSDIRSDIITLIRFKLHEIAMSHDMATSDIEAIKGEDNTTEKEGANTNE